MSDDKFDIIFEKYPQGQKDNMISILQDIQDVEGYISAIAVSKLSKFLSVPTVKIYSVATFYDQFRFEPSGSVCIKVCSGTSCHINQSAAIIEELKKHLNLQNEGKRGGGRFDLEIIPCMGACGKGPVFSIDNSYFTSATPEMVKPALNDFREKHKL